MNSKKMMFLSPERMTAFSDGVIAIAITLLVLNLQIPENSSSISFSQVMLDSLQKLDTWLISFWIIGTFWIMHHKLFKHITAVDMVILWSNMFFLLIITSLSWSVSLIEAYPEEPWAVVVFSSSLGVAGLTHFFIWDYAKRKHFLEEDEKRKRGIFGFLATPMTAVGSICCAFLFAPVLGLYFWILRQFFIKFGIFLDKKLART